MTEQPKQQHVLSPLLCQYASPSFQWLKHQPFILIYVTYMFRVSWFEFSMSPHSGTQAGRIAPKWKHTISLKYFAQI